MSRARWHMTRDGDVLTLARRLPARFDVQAVAAFPPVRRGRLAHQVRQDLWRALQSLRGFSPVIEVTTTAGGVQLRAGGRVDGAVPPGVAAQIAALLADPEKRSRWIARSQIKEAA